MGIHTALAKTNQHTWAVIEGSHEGAVWSIDNVFGNGAARARVRAQVRVSRVRSIRIDRDSVQVERQGEARYVAFRLRYIVGCEPVRFGFWTNRLSSEHQLRAACAAAQLD